MRRPVSCALAAIAFAYGLTLLSEPAFAEEGGSGHYQPGSMASFVDGVPATPTFIVRLDLLHYGGSVDPAVTLPIAGSPTLWAGVARYAFTVRLFHSLQPRRFCRRTDTQVENV